MEEQELPEFAPELVGFLLGLVTLVIAYLTSMPIVLAVIALVLIAGLVLLAKNARRKRRRIQQDLAGTLGHAPSESELGELDYIQLRQLAARDGAISAEDQRCLERWTRRNGWSPEKVAALTHRAEREPTHGSGREKLEALIRYSLADGRIDRSELKTLQTAAGWAGLGRKDLGDLMNQVQSA